MVLRNCLLAALTLPFSASSSEIHAPDHQEHLSILNGPSKNIAIIGAGAAGSSAAYHISQYAAAAGIATNITVFDRSSYVGGRSTTVHAWDDPAQPVELGASIFVKVNHILMDAVARFNLTAAAPDLGVANGNNGLDDEEEDDDKGDYVGIWNGRAFVFRGNDSFGWWDTVKMLWKYGMAPIRTRRLMRETVGNFLKLYEPPHFPWRSLTDKAMELGLVRPVARTGERFLRENGVGELFAGEVIQASTRVNYAQNLPLINGLITMVCMATDGAKSVPGGNWRIFSSFLSSTPNLTTRLNTTVSSLAAHSNLSYTLVPANATTGTPLPAESYDAVILAAPYHQSNLSISPAPAHLPYDLPFVTLHVTLLSSPHRISPSFFGLPASSGPVPRVILTTLPPDVRPDGPKDREFAGPAGFFSVSTLRRGWNPQTGRREFLYKIFSPMAVDDAWLARLFGLGLDEAEGVGEKDISWVYRKVWQSYPYETPRVSFDDVCLDCGDSEEKAGGLWYTGGIEGFISTMETSALMGRNVARLVVDGWVQGKKREEGGAVDADVGADEGVKEL